MKRKDEYIHGIMVIVLLRIHCVKWLWGGAQDTRCLSAERD